MRRMHEYLELHNHISNYTLCGESVEDEQLDSVQVLEQLVHRIKASPLLKEEISALFRVASLKREHAEELTAAKTKATDLKRSVQGGPKMVPQRTIELFQTQLKTMTGPKAAAKIEKLAEMLRKNESCQKTAAAADSATAELKELKERIGLCEVERQVHQNQARHQRASFEGAGFETHCAELLNAAVSYALDDAEDYILLSGVTCKPLQPNRKIPNGCKAEFDLLLVRPRTRIAIEGPASMVDVIGMWEVKANPSDILGDLSKVAKMLNFLKEGSSLTLTGTESATGKKLVFETGDFPAEWNSAMMESGLLPATVSYLTLQPAVSQGVVKELLLPPAYLRLAMRDIAYHPDFEPLQLDSQSAPPSWIIPVAAQDSMLWLPIGRRILGAMSRRGQLLVVNGYSHGGVPHCANSAPLWWRGQMVPIVVALAVAVAAAALLRRR